MTHSQDPKTETRDHAGKAYYKPVAGRPNLHLVIDHQVTRLTTEDSCEAPEVTAVEVRNPADVGTSC